MANIHDAAWLGTTTNNNKNQRIQIETFLKNNCDFSEIKNKIDHSMLSGDKLKDYESLRQSILNNENKYSSVILGLGIFNLFRNMLITGSENASTPITMEMFKEWDHEDAINAFFGISYEYHSPYIVRDGVKSYLTRASGSKINQLGNVTISKTKQKLNYYLAYKHYMYQNNRTK